MVHWYILTGITLLMIACGSSRTENNRDLSTSENSTQQPDSISITQPSDSDFSTGPVYINQVAKIKHKGKTQLQITGMLPDGCSQLYDINYTIDQNELHLDLKSWRPDDALCTQALVEFIHISDKIKKDVLEQIDYYVIEGIKTELNSDLD
ncbi:MAG: hypothetical protein WD267_10550 [Balneolales bacterium]